MGGNIATSLFPFIRMFEGTEPKEQKQNSGNVSTSGPHACIVNNCYYKQVSVITITFYELRPVRKSFVSGQQPE